MPRIITALIAVIMVSSLSWAAAAFARNPATAGSLNGQADLTEVSRLIDVFEARVADHTDPLDYRNLGTHYLTRASLTGNLADYQAARTAFATGVELAPEATTGRMGLARASAALHDFSTSLEQATAITTVEPANSAAWLLMGDAYLELGDLGAAEGAFARAPASDPSVMARYAELAHLRGQQDDAIRHAAAGSRRAREIGLGGRALAFHLLFEADLRFDAGDYGTALELSMTATDIAPDWAPGHAAAGQALAALDDMSAADTAYQRALELQPGDPTWLLARADFAFLRGDALESHRLRAEAERVYLETDSAIYGRSLALLWADQAINLERALELAEDDLSRRQDIGAYDAYGWVLYRLGRVDEAVAALAKATRFGTQDGELRFHSAMIAAAAGDVEGARTELESLLAMSPRFHPTSRWIALQTLDALSD